MAVLIRTCTGGFRILALPNQLCGFSFSLILCFYLFSIISFPSSPFVWFAGFVEVATIQACRATKDCTIQHNEDSKWVEDSHCAFMTKGTEHIVPIDAISPTRKIKVKCYHFELSLCILFPRTDLMQVPEQPLARPVLENKHKVVSYDNNFYNRQCASCSLIMQQADVKQRSGKEANKATWSSLVLSSTAQCAADLRNHAWSKRVPMAWCTSGFSLSCKVHSYPKRVNAKLTHVHCFTRYQN